MIGLGLLCGVNVLNTLGKKMRNTLQVYLGLGGIALGTGLMAFVPFVASGIAGCFLIGFSAAGIASAWRPSFMSAIASACHASANSRRCGRGISSLSRSGRCETGFCERTTMVSSNAGQASSLVQAVSFTHQDKSV